MACYLFLRVVAFRLGLSLLILLHSSVECITVYDTFLYTHKWLLGVGGWNVGRDAELALYPGAVC